MAKVKKKKTNRKKEVPKRASSNKRSTTKSSKTKARIRRSSSGATSATKNISNLSMRLFGIPYQFTDIVDPRLKSISPTIGRNYTEHILMEAPVCTIIPGNPAFLPAASKENKMSTAQALLSGNDVVGINSLLGDLKEGEMKLYDFQPDYHEYMNYVNAMCRCGATFLQLGDDTDGITGNSKPKSSSFEMFDWRQYRWNERATQSFRSRWGSKNVRFSFHQTDDENNNSGETLTSLAKSYNYIQFYIDSDVSPDESLQNSTGASTFKGMLDQGSGVMKDIAFMANSGGIDYKTIESFGEGLTSAVQSGVGAILGSNGISSSLSRIINLSSETLKGNNLIIPDIYQSSEYSKSYSFTVHLKSPYGTRFGYYYNIFVPMMHLLALVMPRQQSANSFSSPFLVKAYVNNTFTCNLGIASSISIQKVSDSFSTSGLPSEVDVTLNITDLYSDLMMSPSNKPKMFIENTSLVEYLAGSCGLDLTSPNIDLKWGKTLHAYAAAVKDIPTNLIGPFEQKVKDLISSTIGMGV